MATQSFYESLIIETEEQVQILLKAFEDADNRPPKPPMSPSISEMIARGNKLAEDGYFDRLMQDYNSE
jgi:predicted ester cyclase